MKNKTNYDKIKEYFLYNKNKWIKSNIFASLYGIKGQELRELIKVLRSYGHKIIANTNRGYMLTTDKESIIKYYINRRNMLFAELENLERMIVW